MIQCFCSKHKLKCIDREATGACVKQKYLKGGNSYKIKYFKRLHDIDNKMTDIEDVNIHLLPDNILLEILSYLSVRDLCRSGR